MSDLKRPVSGPVRCGLLAIVLLLGATSLEAQEATDRGGVFLGGGIAVARGSTEVGGATGSASGVGFLGIIAGVNAKGSRSYSLDVQLEPFEVQNPQRDERYSSLSFVVSAYLGPIGIGLGWQHRFWSGTDVWVESDGGPALQLTAAVPLVPAGGWHMSPDAFVRLSGGDEIATASLGLRLAFGRLSG